LTSAAGSRTLQEPLSTATEGGTDMGTSDLIQYARALYNAHGDKAEAEAAQKVVAAQGTGDQEEAEKWRLIRGHIKELRGPKVT